MRAFIVSVDYWDYLALTLPYNRHHFSEVWIITSPRDNRTLAIAEANDCNVHATNIFWEGGADFNKWAALEECFGVAGRHGWIVAMDADIAWPKTIPVIDWKIGTLYVPFRLNGKSCVAIPDEREWGKFDIYHPRQFAGYSQIFHASDANCEQVPWYETDWRHAGGADTFFEKRWDGEKKVRPPFSCLHLGPPGANWAGRSSEYLNGLKDDSADSRRRKMEAYRLSRKRRRGNERYTDERLG
jgi:hypothetical protein